MILTHILEQRTFVFAEEFATWQQAIVACCKPLVEIGAVDETYASQIISSIQKYGAYIVIAPYIALPHCQENANGVKKTVVGFMRVRQPVIFDPEDRSKDAELFFTLAAENSQQHLQNIAALATALDNENLITALRKVESEQQLREVAKKFCL